MPNARADVRVEVRVDADVQLDGGLRQFDGGLALAWTCDQMLGRVAV